MRLHIASNCAAINPADWVAASPRASSNRAASRSTGMPAARQHLRTMQGHADARADLETGDGAQQELVACHVTELFRAGQQRGNDHRRAVQGAQRMEVVELEALDEGAVEQASHRSAGATTPADDRLVAGPFEARDGLDRRAGPRQARADERAGNTVQYAMLGAGLHVVG